MRGVFVAMLVLACGGGGAHHLADGAPDSPFQDAPKPPASGIVTITVTLQGSAVDNVLVFFQNADSSVVLETETIGGSASASMNPGGFVTVFEPEANGVLTGSGNGSIATFAGVKPGDNLLDDLQPVLQNTSVTVELVAPIDTLGGSAVASYQAFPSCGGATELQGPSVTAAGSNLPPTQLNLDNCNGSADLIIASFDANGAPIDAFVAGGVPISSDSTVTLTGTYAPSTQQLFSITDVPAEVSNVNLTSALYTFRGVLIRAFANVAAGSASLATLTRDPAVNAAYAFDLAPTGTVRDEQFLIDWGSQPASVTKDIGAAKLRSWLTSAQLDPIQAQLGWVVGTSGTAPDYVLAEVNASRNTGGTFTSWTWRLVAGPDSDGAMQFPTLPVNDFDYNFHDTDNISVGQLFGITSPGGYDPARDAAIDALNFGSFNDPIELATTRISGSVAIQEVLPVLRPAAVRRPSRAPTNQRPRARATVLDGRHALRTAR